MGSPFGSQREHVEELQRWRQEDGARIATLEAELTRCRTTEQAAAHALDALRQSMGLHLIQGEHPADTRKRIEADLERARKREVEYRKGLAHIGVHIADMEDAWRGGGVSDHEGKGGQRSCATVECRVIIDRLLTEYGK